MTSSSTPFTLERRTLLKASMMGLFAMGIPAARAAVIGQQGFTHGIASGEPRANSVLLWTRFVAPSDATLTAEIAEDEEFAKVVSYGEVVAGAARDYTAKITLDGLTPDRWYFYRFVAPDGSTSVTGRTRTLPVGDITHFGIGLFSCSNMGWGHFNAYAHAAEREDLDLMVHVGDYIYEYGADNYPSKAETVGGRIVEPEHEILALADYRMRYACYRADADLQRIHQMFPMILQWDDHESANDSWVGGAENHQAEEGDWPVRRAAAVKAYREWLPVSEDRYYDDYQIGTLATIFRPETRVVARDEQFSLGKVLAGQENPVAALEAFRKGAYLDEAHTLMGGEQEQWLYDGLKASKDAGTKWQIVAQQIVMGKVLMPPQIMDWTKDGGDWIKQFAQVTMASASVDLPFNLDSWDGYPAARSRLLQAAQAADADLVVLSGDSHNAWGNNLTEGGKPAGVEFAGQSVSSIGFEHYLPHVKPSEIAAALTGANPGLVFSDASRRGYVSVSITPEAVTGAWHFMETVAEANPAVAETKSMKVLPGQRILQDA